MKKIELLGIDPQYDFCDVPEQYKARQLNQLTKKEEVVNPALPVPGAWDDSVRLAEFIKRAGQVISKITITLDTHQQYDIAHPLFWKNKSDQHPSPFTAITNKSIKDEEWLPVDITKKDYVLDYTKALEDAGLYTLFIWPAHCIIGTVGHNVISPIMNELLNWESKYISRVNYLTKGHNPYTEHYGGFQAEYPLPNDNTTQLNSKLIEKFQKADIILLTGQALSHCVASTVRQLANNFGEENIKKLVLLSDTTSSVAGFEKQGQDFVKEMEARGMRVIKTTDIQITKNDLIF
jgi:nicotinamidase/pyrazinamidase